MIFTLRASIKIQFILFGVLVVRAGVVVITLIATSALENAQKDTPNLDMDFKANTYVRLVWKRTQVRHSGTADNVKPVQTASTSRIQRAQQTVPKGF